MKKAVGALDRVQPAWLEALLRKRLRSQVRRSHRIAAVWPQVLLACAGLAVSVCLLVATAYVVGKGAGKSSALGKALSATAAKPPVALVLGAILVLVIGGCLRRIWLEVLVRLPGPILVRDLSVPSDLTGVDGAGLSATFRTRLQRLRLQAATPVPGAIPAQNFLEMLDSDHLDAKNPLASFVSILRAAIPTHAYEVSAALVVRPAAASGRPRYGVTAQVTRLPREAIPVQTGWLPTCEEAVIQAADIVTGAILPRTRLSNCQPWSGWRRYAMDSLLVHHFECAEELTSERRYDEALNRYACALELDPKNVDLRLHQGFVQEKLGLSLDALATYAAARMIATDTDPSLYHFGARRDRTASGRIACYRLAVLLAGVNVAHQWRKADHETLRGQQRERLRERLRPELLELLRNHRLMIDDPKHGGTGKKKALGAQTGPLWKESEIEALLDARGSDGDTAYLQLLNVLACLAESILESVKVGVSRPWAPGTLLSPLAVELAIESLKMRRQWVTHELAQRQGVPKDPWRPPEAEALIPRSAKFSTWSERYNAACLYASPLLLPGEPIDGAAESEFVKRAVKELEDAMSCATSWYVASRRDWVLSEDPALRALRDTSEFKHFETIYLPSASLTPERPPDVHRWEQSRYSHDLLAETAMRWEREWHRRRDELPHTLDPHALLDWCADDAEAWKLVRSVAGEYRHWRVRFDLIDQMMRWGAKYGFEPLQVRTPLFASRQQAGGLSIADEIKANRTRLAEIARELAKMEAQRPQPELFDTDRGRELWPRRAGKQHDLTDMCEVRAILWHRLHEWVNELPHLDTGSGHREFKHAMAQLGKEARNGRAAPAGVLAGVVRPGR